MSSQAPRPAVPATIGEVLTRPLAAVRTAAPARAGWAAAIALGAHRHRLAIAVTVIVAMTLLVSGKGMTDETVLSMEGDMPRYLMNAAYFRDLAADLPFDDPLGYTFRYFVRYPALSLGHHPVLTSLAAAAAYAVFGVSVFAARLPISLSAVAAALGLFLLVRRWYGTSAGAAAALLLATSPVVAGYSRVVMSELPTLALTVLAMLALVRYTRDGRTRNLAAFTLLAIASAYSKQIAVLLFPVYALYAAATLGPRRLFSRPMILAAAAVAALLVPLVYVTWQIARVNVAIVSYEGAADRLAVESLAYFPRVLWREQMTPWAVGLAGAGLAAAAAGRDGRASLFALWIAVFYALITYVSVPEVRYGLYWVPAFCALAAAFPASLRWPRARRVAAAVVWLVVLYQAAGALAAPVQRAGGYEDAARYVVEHAKGDTVLYSAAVDSGYFPFFVRKHDEARRLVILRADKLLTTSRMGEIAIEERVSSPEEIYERLRTFGTAYVVIEDVPTSSRALEWLRSEVRTSRFALRATIPLDTDDRRLRGADVRVYEYLEHVPADRAAVLDYGIPLMGRHIRVVMGDLLGRQDR